MKLALLAFGALFLGSAMMAEPKDEVPKFKSWKRLTAKAVEVPDPYSGYCASIYNPNPHDGYMIHAYANPAAQDKAVAGVEAVKKDDERKLAMTFPEGSILVKTKFGSYGRTGGGRTADPSRNYPIELMTVMIKGAKGSFPKSGDWDFLVMDGAGKKLLGKQNVKECWNCHQDAPADGAFLKYGL